MRCVINALLTYKGTHGGVQHQRSTTYGPNFAAETSRIRTVDQLKRDGHCAPGRGYTC